MSLRQTKGDRAERAARQWLEDRGLICIEENYTCRLGEIDLIMRDHDDTLVFVEVRLRKHTDYGGAAASVNRSKQRKLRLTADHYVATHGVSARRPCRIDVVAIQAQGQDWLLDWIKNAVGN